MGELKSDTSENSKEELEKVVERIAMCAQEKYNTVMKELKEMRPEGGKINSQKFWKLKRKMAGKHTDPPAAMFHEKLNLLTSDQAIQERAIEVYKERLKGNPIEKHLKDHEQNVNKLCEERLKLVKLQKTDPWTEDDLNEALKDLDNGNARDALGYSNEIFKNGVAGSDLKLATLKLMNHIKKVQKYPKALQPCNITSLYKNKGSRKDFMNYRGVFRVTVLRSILDRLIYNDSYATIDENITDGNVGARKSRNIRDNIYVIGAVSNSVINGHEDPIQVQVMDIDKCFD